MDKERKIVVEISHCRDCPHSISGCSIPFMEFTTETRCLKMLKNNHTTVCYQDGGTDSSRDHFIPDWCPLLKILNACDKPTEGN